jgi:hypothetical protein
MAKKKNPAIRFLDPTVESFETIVGPRTVFRGNIAAFESIRIDGKVIGNIESPPGSNIRIERSLQVESKVISTPQSAPSFMMELIFMGRSFMAKLGLSRVPN